MDGDARDTTHCLHEHILCFSSLIFIKDFSHFSPSTFVSAFQIFFIIVILMYVMSFVIAVHDCSVAALSLYASTRTSRSLWALRERVHYDFGKSWVEPIH